MPPPAPLLAPLPVIPPEPFAPLAPTVMSAVLSVPEVPPEAPTPLEVGPLLLFSVVELLAEHAATAAIAAAHQRDRTPTPPRSPNIAAL
jgi:hypothetical protein